MHLLLTTLRGSCSISQSLLGGLLKVNPCQEQS